MGAAATQRGDALVARQAREGIEREAEREALARGLEAAEDCNVFTRAALSFLQEPTGLRSGSVERAKTRRGWSHRHAALVAAHARWVDVDARDALAYVRACVERARAARALLEFALGTWSVPASIVVPRAAR